MSSKINISAIIKGHLETLKATSGKFDLTDVVTFFCFPLLCSIASLLLHFDLDKDISSLLVNFGSIFTALLLSVLVLVYDQESKINDAGQGDALKSRKMALLRELYHNISFSILCAIFLVFLCFMHAAFTKGGVPYDLDICGFKFIISMYLITPIIVFVVAVTFLNILMVVKRVHSLLLVR